MAIVVWLMVGESAYSQIPNSSTLLSDVTVFEPPLSNPVEGESASSEKSLAMPKDVDQEFNQLRERIEKLEASQSERAEDKSSSAVTKESVKKEPEDPLERFYQGWNVRLGGHVQLDYVNWATADASIPNAHDYFEFRRLRLVADGVGYGVLDFRLQMTLEPETIGETQPLGFVMSPDVKDAYLSMNEIPLLGRFRIGNFFVPFSLEQVTNDTNNIFLERSIPSQGIFAVDREVGIAFYNANEAQNITWTYGAFFDSISEGLKERIDDNQGHRLSGRLTWLPYYDEATDGRYLIHTGAGVLFTGDQDDRVRFRARPQVREGPRLIDTGPINADHYTVGNLELAIVNGALTLQTEAFYSDVATTTGSEHFQGAYLHLSYFLTGENRVYERFGQHGPQFARNVPRRNFFYTRDCQGPGAWELKVRWSYLDLDDANAGQYNDFTAGFNWYWTDRVRIMFDWIHPITSEETLFGATTSNLIATRFDFNW